MLFLLSQVTVVLTTLTYLEAERERMRHLKKELVGKMENLKSSQTKFRKNLKVEIKT